MSEQTVALSSMVANLELDLEGWRREAGEQKARAEKAEAALYREYERPLAICRNGDPGHCWPCRTEWSSPSLEQHETLHWRWLEAQTTETPTEKAPHDPR